MITVSAIVTVLLLFAACVDNVLSKSPYGEVNFINSCDIAQNSTFQLGIGALYSFWFPAARHSFESVYKADKTCCIALWGAAMSLFHPIWDYMLPERAAEGAAILQRAEVCLNSTTTRASQTERSLIHAAVHLFQPVTSEMQAKGALQVYVAEMRTIHNTYPRNDDVATLYGLALLALGYYSNDATPNEQGVKYAHERTAGALETLVAMHNPSSPGALHYIIHSYDQPGLAEQALWAARRYGAIAPAVSHALHMPSHIYLDLGMYEDAIESNVAAMSQAFDDVNGDINNDWAHASNFLCYALLQLGQEKAVRYVIDAYPKLSFFNNTMWSPSDVSRVYLHYMIETRQYEQLATLSLQSWMGDTNHIYNWSSVPNILIFESFGQFYGNLMMDNFDEAKNAIHRMSTLNASLPDAWFIHQLPYYRLSFDTLVAAGQAWLKWFASPGEGLSAMRAVVAREAEIFSPEIGHLLSAAEQLALMLTRGEEHEAALEIYQAELEKRPNRFHLLLGAGFSAMNASKPDVALPYFESLSDLVERGAKLHLEAPKGLAESSAGSTLPTTALDQLDWPGFQEAMRQLRIARESLEAAHNGNSNGECQATHVCVHKTIVYSIVSATCALVLCCISIVTYKMISRRKLRTRIQKYSLLEADDIGPAVHTAQWRVQ